MAKKRKTETRTVRDPLLILMDKLVPLLNRHLKARAERPWYADRVAAMAFVMRRCDHEVLNVIEEALLEVRGEAGHLRTPSEEHDLQRLLLKVQP